jgi:hypothetical protein
VPVGADLVERYDRARARAAELVTRRAVLVEHGLSAREKSSIDRERVPRRLDALDVFLDHLEVVYGQRLGRLAADGRGSVADRARQDDLRQRVAENVPM